MLIGKAIKLTVLQTLKSVKYDRIFFEASYMQLEQSVSPVEDHRLDYMRSDWNGLLEMQVHPHYIRAFILPETRVDNPSVTFSPKTDYMHLNSRSGPSTPDLCFARSSPTTTSLSGSSPHRLG